MNEFYNSTPREFNNIVSGYRKRETALFQNSWEQTRSIVFSVLSPYLKNKNAKGSDVMSFPWEKQDEGIDLKAEIEAVQNSNKPFWDRVDKSKKALN